MLDFAIDTAYRAGVILRAGLERERQIDSKGQSDFVTDVDRASEDMIVSAIRSRYPSHRILAEESGQVADVGDYTWLIDPLDGTTNYMHRFPWFAVSIGLLHKHELVLGVVYDPSRDQLFAAERGSGARCNGRRISVSSTTSLGAALLTTGFSYDRFTRPDNNLDHFARILLMAQDVRRPGSAALDLCGIAAGQIDGHWELRLSPWDTAAGVAILIEAGGQASDMQGQPWTPWSPHIVATNGCFHNELITALNQ